MRSQVFAMLCLLCALSAAPAVAQSQQDWLAVFPPCAQSTGSRAGLELLYPRPGLPAVVAAGAALVARIRLPAALTPPPGVQQERALLGWHAEIESQLQPLGHAVTLSHRHVLPVTNLRPDGASSLVYRASLAVPAYAAPGTYTLVLRTPFGERRIEHAVRVLAAGRDVRLAWLPRELSVAAGRDLESLPVDVWLADGWPTAAPAQPVFLPSAHAVAVRVERRLFVTRAAVCEPASASLAEVALVLGAEQRTQAAFEPVSVAPDHYLPLAAAQAAGLACTAQLAQTTSPTGVLLQLSNLDHGSARETALLVPVGQRLSVQGAEVAFFPASDVTLRHPEAIVAQLRVPPGGTARLSLQDVSSVRPFMRAQQYATTGAAAVLPVLGAPPGSSVAFDYGFARTAFGGPQLAAAFPAPGAHPISALVLSPDGTATALHAELWVQARRPATCATAVVNAGARGSSLGPALLFVAAMLLKRRRTRRFGNRLQPPRRCLHRGESFGEPLSKHSPAQATVSPICSSTRSSTPGSRPLARSRLGGTRERARVLFSLAAAGLGLCACEATMIPNTRVEDTSENREVVDFVEKYRLAVEERNTPILLSMASENYFDDMGTPAGEDDVDYDALKKGLARMHEDVSGARYQVSYRAVSYAADRHVLVDMMYTGWFRVTPVGAGEPVWKRRLSAHRIVLDREDKAYKILSGM